jgi:hypothetical protein
MQPLQLQTTFEDSVEVRQTAEGRGKEGERETKKKEIK